MQSIKDIQNMADMRYLEKYYESHKYLDIPCANCGSHYWKVPDEKGEAILTCPKCKKITKIRKEEFGLIINPY